MKVLHAASECLGIAKTGGLADVVAALPAAQHAMGMDVRVCLPAYPGAREKLNDARTLCTITVRDTPFELIEGTLGADGLRIWLLDCPPLFDRPGDPYRTPEGYEHSDNHWRFGLFSEAVSLLALGAGDWQPDVLHLHDWQVGLAAAWTARAPQRPRIVFTIHNLAYQGVYPATDFAYLGLRWDNFTPDKLEAHGAINFLKGGIVYADAVNTVSPNYARETKAPAGGCGLAPFLNGKGERYRGILNGADYQSWDPAHDLHLPANYHAADLNGKAVCKRKLQQRFGLAESPRVPILGVVSRFVGQKGLDLLAATCDELLRSMQVQLAILGSGEKDLEHYFGGLAARYPGRVGTHIGYDEALSRWITAGSDFFIMPSRYEPCGLNQIYSLRYGTLPIVRATGGLDDTIEQYDETQGTGTGFKFWDPSASALYYTIGWAVSTYYDRPAHHQAMIQQAMAQDFSWERSAADYVRLYEQARAART